MKHNVLITLILTSLFFFSHLIGLYTVQAYIDTEKTAQTGTVTWSELPSIAGINVERPDVEPQESIWFITGAVILGTILILLIIKLQTMIIWKIWFLFAVVLCLNVAFGAFIPSNASLLLALAFGLLKVFKPNIIVHNLTELFIYAGLAAIFVPILNVFYAAIMLILLSAYDMYAVWKSKHMIKMAKFQTKSGIFAGLLVPYQKPTFEKKTPKQTKTRTAVLGGGDIGFPLIFSGTILITSGFANAAIVSICATFSLLALLLLSQKDKFYPAMPFLSAGCFAGYALTLLI